MTEDILEPDLPIVDPHHHLWVTSGAALTAMAASEDRWTQWLHGVYRRYGRYLFDDLLADVGSGHNVRATVFVDAHAMYRPDGPPELRSVGEVEFVNGVAAMAASGAFGEVKACAGIVGGVDLRMGDRVGDVLAAHVQAGGGRYRGVRTRGSSFDPHLREMAALYGGGEQGVLANPVLRQGLRQLERMGLSFDVFILEPQIPELIDLARAVPGVQIIANHLCGPLGVGHYEGRLEERFPIWARNMRALAACENVAVKVGGLGWVTSGLPSTGLDGEAGSAQLAAEWRPYVETAIEAFGVGRCMFESNFPADGGTARYATIWNAFKRITAGASGSEKQALYHDTAARIYRLDL